MKYVEVVNHNEANELMKRYGNNILMLCFQIMAWALLYCFISLLLNQYNFNLLIFTTQYNSLVNFMLLGIALAVLLYKRIVSRTHVEILIFALLSAASTIMNNKIYERTWTIVLLFISNQLFWFTTYTISVACAEIAYNREKMISIMQKGGITLFLFNLLFLINRPVNSSATVYYSLSLLPIFLTLQNKKFRLVLTVSVALLLFVSNKRTGIIALILAIISYLWVDGKISKQIDKKRNRIVLFLFSILVLYLLVSFVANRYGVDIIANFMGFASDGGSHRDIIYASVLDAIKSSNPMNLLMGHGFNSVFYNKIAFDISTYSFTSAHSDFLEVLYDYGAIGFALYIIMLINVLKNAINMYRSRHRLSPAFTASIMIYLVLSMFSHLIIYQTYIAILFMFWSYCVEEYKGGQRYEKNRNYYFSIRN